MSTGADQTGEVQPYIHRLTRLGALAEELGAGIAFADEVSALIWGGTEGWDQGEHLAQAAHRAGLDLEGMDQCLISRGRPVGHGDYCESSRA